jgi:lathosterol oxidase
MSEPLRQWLVCAGASCAVSLVTFFGLGGMVHWWFYVRRRDRAAEWKHQPRRFLTRARERHAVRLGGVNIVLSALAGGTLAWHVQRGGWSTLHLDAGRHGISWHVVSLVLALAMMDAGLYYSHRLLHHRFLFRHIHRLHHIYLAPVVFTTLAMHPVELALFSLFVFLPAFVIPMHAGVFVVALAYTYLVGMIDHAGIRSRWRLPFHSDGFHDDHHIYVHCNYGHHTTLFDRFHGTVRTDQPAAADGEV